MWDTWEVRSSVLWDKLAIFIGFYFEHLGSFEPFKKPTEMFMLIPFQNESMVGLTT